MASLASSLYDLFSGNPAAGEQAALGSLGTGQTATGEGLVTPSATYYENILSGDPAKIAQSLAPEISMGQQQTEQGKLTSSEFGTRSGGTAAANAAADAANRANLIDLVGGLQSGAAGSAGSLGSSQESLGAGNIGTEAQMAIDRQNQVASDVGGIAQGAAQIA